jgi:two-component system chemotaxis sensor kinase CheA
MVLHEDVELIKEFLIESNENLGKVDQQMVELEKCPQNKELLASLFRTIHTIKGTCGFLGFGILEEVTHGAENLLSQLRNGERTLTPPLVSVLLEAVDATKTIVARIEATGKEGEDTWHGVRQRLHQAERGSGDGNTQSERSESISAGPAKEAEAPVIAEATPVKQEVEPAPASIPPPASQSAATTKPGSSVSDSTIRVDVGLLDKLMNLVGELVLARNQILQYNATQEDTNFASTTQRLNLITTELQESVMKTRMQPIGVVWSKLPRVVRDLAAACGKQIRLEMDGAETELDKTIIEAIKDPLTHIVRNCCDHGIESPDVRTGRGKPAQGLLALRAYHEGGHVNIEIVDDGGGIDPTKVKAKAVEKGLLRPEQAERMNDREAVNLVFLPGFSTAAKVSNISGRGVGMDVVKTNIEKIGGMVDLTSRPGAGTTVKIKIPLTLAIIPGLVVASGTERFVIPQVSLLELVRLEGEDAGKLIEKIHGTPVYRRRGTLLPVAYLNRILQLPEGGDRESVNIVVLQAEDRQFGLVVDSISDTQEIVVKPLSKQLKGLNVYAGSTIMGDGKVALILDVMGLAQRTGLAARDAANTHGHHDEATCAAERQTLLLFRAGSFERLAVPLSLVARLEEFSKDRVEQAAGRKVVQYRSQILPLIPLSEQLDGSRPDWTLTEKVPVVVFSEGDRCVGLVVDQIVDIVEDVVSVRKPSSQHGLIGSAVVGEKVTDFLDLGAVLMSSGERIFGEGGRTHHRPVILVAGPSALERGLVRSYIEMTDCKVVEAATVEEALDRSARERMDAVIAGESLLEAVRKRLPDIPLMEFGDRDAMLRSIESLAGVLNSRNGLENRAVQHEVMA